MPSSASTTRTVQPACAASTTLAMVPPIGGHRQAKPEPASPGRRVFEAHRPFLSFDDRLARRQPKTRAPGFGGKEGPKQLRCDSRRYPGTGVGDAGLDDVAIAAD